MTVSIATLYIDKAAVLASAFSRSRLQEQRHDPTNPLARFLAWIKAEEPRSFNPSQAVLGKNKDNYIIVYYANGIRYKLLRNAQVLISGADATQSFTNQEQALQQVVNSIIATETLYLLQRLINNQQTVILTTGKIKEAVNSSSKYASQALMGIKQPS